VLRSVLGSCDSAAPIKPSTPLVPFIIVDERAVKVSSVDNNRKKKTRAKSERERRKTQRRVVASKRNSQNSIVAEGEDRTVCNTAPACEVDRREMIGIPRNGAC
jgi:hypothetical protein